MPRSARPRRAAKRPTKWCGQIHNALVPDNGSLAVADGNALCRETSANSDNPDPLAGWVKGQISLSRVSTGDINPAVAWAIVLMRTAAGGALAPIQVFNPFGLEEMEIQDILGMGYCEIPPTVLNGADAHVINRQATVTNINIKVGRRLLRNRNNLFFWIASEGATDNAYHAIASFRTLMKFG